MRIILMTLSFTVFSVWAVFYSLGYQINWAARSIQQTAILEIDHTYSQGSLVVLLNNTMINDQLPIRIDHVFPGVYDLTIRRDSYQDWHRTLEIPANRAVNFKNVLLIKKIPETVTVPEGYVLPKKMSNTKGINFTVNELRVDGSIVTRTSQDIVAARWFPDNEHLIYQAGNTIYLTEPDGKATMQVAALSSSTPTIFDFQENGRILFFEDGGTTRSLSLFD